MAVTNLPTEAPGRGPGPARHRAGRVALGAVPIAVIAAASLPLLFLVLAAFSTGVPGDADSEFTVAKVVEAYTDPALLAALRNSLVLGLTVAVVTTVVTLPIAWVLIRTNAPGRRLLGRLMTFAFFLSPLLLAMAWAAIGAPRTGLLSQLYRTITGSDGGLGDVYSFAGIVFVSVLHFVPLSYLLISGALVSAAGAVDDASQMSRANPWQTLRRVTVPLAMPTIVASFLQVAVFGAEEFAIPWFLGISDGYRTLPTQIYADIALSSADYNRAAAAGTMLLWFTIAGVFLFRKYTKTGNRYATLAGKHVRARPVDLGRWRWAASAMVAGYLFLSVGAPLLALLWGSLNAFPSPTLTFDNVSLSNWEKVLGDPQTLHAMTNSLLVAVVGASVAVIACVVIGYVIVRTDTFGRVAADYATSLPLAVPAIVLGLGVLWLYIRLPLPLYGTLVGLGLAYSIRFLGYGVRAVNAGLLQIHTDLIEAAHTSRARPGRVIRTVVFPLLRPTVGSAWVVLFVRFVQELNMTVLLYTQAIITVPVLMFVKLSSSLQNAIYPLALLLMLVTFVCVQVIHSRENVHG
ncbi:ABC transporter permease [Actinophytocola sp.]|uniref:ABC transporter permease n=1 Tax=Actinophytocola sp. TaxID=1872138 RepID=UPI003D6B292C